MNIRKFASLALVMALSLGVTSCGSKKPAEEGKEEAKVEEKAEEGKEAKSDGKAKKIAVLLYNGSDTYIASVRQQLEKLDEEDDSIELVYQDGQNNQGTQTDQLNNVIAQGVDGIFMNIVDISATARSVASTPTTTILSFDEPVFIPTA